MGSASPFPVPPLPSLAWSAGPLHSLGFPLSVCIQPLKPWASLPTCEQPYSHISCFGAQPRAYPLGTLGNPVCAVWGDSKPGMNWVGGEGERGLYGLPGALLRLRDWLGVPKL